MAADLQAVEFSRRWLALWIVQLASQSTFFSSSRKAAILSVIALFIHQCRAVAGTGGD